MFQRIKVRSPASYTAVECHIFSGSMQATSPMSDYTSRLLSKCIHIKCIRNLYPSRPWESTVSQTAPQLAAPHPLQRQRKERTENHPTRTSDATVMRCLSQRFLRTRWKDPLTSQRRDTPGGSRSPILARSPPCLRGAAAARARGARTAGGAGSGCEKPRKPAAETLP